MQSATLNKMLHTFSNTEKMPVLFVGHGSPMNAIDENEFVAGFRKIGKEIDKPHAILCISAHWETRGTQVTAMTTPPTIHDFGGFPKELYQVEYPAPGNPELAKTTQSIVTKTDVTADENWGLDHGAWSVIRHMYPEANVPTVQLSLDYTKPAKYHYELAHELKSLREKGVLIVGSGNMVHNLRKVDWRKLKENFGFEWALEANQKMKQFIENRNHEALISYDKQGSEFRYAIPTPEHYLPMLYALALQESHEEASFFNDQAVAGAISMTSFKIG